MQHGTLSCMLFRTVRGVSEIDQNVRAEEEKQVVA